MYILSEWSCIALNGTSIQTSAKKYTVNIKLQYSKACYNILTPTRLYYVNYEGKLPKNDLICSKLVSIQLTPTKKKTLSLQQVSQLQLPQLWY
jgi:hypothetical protein